MIDREVHPYCVKVVKPHFGTAAEPLEDSVVVCPTCGSGDSHIRRVFTRIGNDPYEAKIYCGTEIGEIGYERRSALVVDLDGECGHAFQFVIQQRKGQNFILRQSCNSKIQDLIASKLGA